MSDYLKEQRVLLESTVIKKLLTGYHIQGEEKNEVINSCLDINAHRYTVIILSMTSDSKITRADEIENIALWKSQIKTLLEKLLTGVKLYLYARKAKMVQDLCRYNENNFKDSVLSADNVGEELGITGNCIFKLCKEYYGTSFHQYLEKVPMDNTLLQLEDEIYKPIKDISMESGYAIQTTFYKAIKKNFGKSPGDYRKSKKN